MAQSLSTGARAVNGSTLNRINIQDGSGTTQPTVSFDEIRLVP